MTKNASLQQFQKVKEKLAKAGMSIKRNLDTNEYQVYPKGDEPGGRSTHFTGSLSEDDLEDALNTGLDMAKRLKTRKNPKSEIFKAISRSSKLPIYQAYMGFNTPIWRGNAKNEKDACERAYADTGTSPIFAKLWEKAIQNPKCKTIQVRRKIRILGKPRVVQVKRKICNPELDLARMKRLLTSELSQYDERLQKKLPNKYRLGIYFGAVDRAFDRLDENSTLEDMKKSICRSFDPELPPVKKFLKKYT